MRMKRGIIPALHARRCRRLIEFAGDSLCFRGNARSHAHVAWLALVGFVYVLWQIPQLGGFIFPTLALFVALSVIALFDARYFIIPDGPILFLIASGAAMICLSDLMTIPSRFAAALAAYFSFNFVAWAYQKLRGTPGLGMGDAKLFAVAGLWLGLDGLPSCLLFAVITALASAAISLREGSLTSFRQPLPFGSHLALGLWLVWAFGPLEAI